MSARWQYTFDVLGHVSRTFNPNPAGPNGNRTRNGNDDPTSGFRAITNSTGLQSSS